MRRAFPQFRVDILVRAGRFGLQHLKSEFRFFELQFALGIFVLLVSCTEALFFPRLLQAKPLLLFLPGLLHLPGLLLGRQSFPAMKGADFVVTGDVTEFGRKEVGDHQLFGLLGRGKSQVAYAKVALNIVNISTSEVVFSSQGAGEYALSNREIIGFGGTASYDSTLNGKVLDLAVREAVNKLVAAIDSGAWKLQN